MTFMWKSRSDDCVSCNRSSPHTKAPPHTKGPVHIVIKVSTFCSGPQWIMQCTLGQSSPIPKAIVATIPCKTLRWFELFQDNIPHHRVSACCVYSALHKEISGLTTMAMLLGFFFNVSRFLAGDYNISSFRFSQKRHKHISLSAPP